MSEPARNLPARRIIRKFGPGQLPAASAPVSDNASLPRAINAAATASATPDAGAARPSHGGWRGLVQPIAFAAPVGLSRRVFHGLGVLAAVALGALGASLLASSHAGPAKSGAVASVPLLNWKAPLALGPNQADARRLAEELRALRDSLAALKEIVSRAKTDDETRALRERVAGLADGVERVKQDTGARLAQIATQLDRIERSEREPSPKLTQMLDKLDRVEHQTAALTTGTIAPGAPAASSAPTKTAVDDKPKAKPIEGWVLRDIYDGIALVEGRRGMVEVAPGQNLPGVGRVEKFERRGRQWVVVTDKGFIASSSN